MTQLFLNPLTKFTSDNITSLPGARLYFYQNNSSTPKAVYADKAKVTSLGVYVEADSAGIFEPIWLDGTYRATLKYSTNWTSDPVGVVQTGWPIDDVGDIGNFAAYAAWDSTFTYDITTNTFVTGPDGNYYKSTQNPNLNKNPVSNPDYWDQIFIVTVFNEDKPGGYDTGDIVKLGPALFASNTDNNTTTPPDASWDSLTFNSGYEEGTFTPTIKGSTGAGTVTYNNRNGYYSRFGRICFFNLKLDWSNIVGATGVLMVGGLPFTALNGSGLNVLSVYYDGLVVGAGLQLCAANIMSGTDVNLYACDPAGGGSTTVAIDTSGSLFISGAYLVTI